MKLRILSLLWMCSLLISCAKDENPGNKGNNNVPSQIPEFCATFTTGYQYSFRKAYSYIDGVTTLLQDEGKYIYTDDAVISPDGEVVITGCQCDKQYQVQSHYLDSCRLIVFRDGVKQILSAESFFRPSKAKVEITSGGDEYIAGTENNLTSLNDYIVLWKNGIKQQVTSTSSHSELYDFCVSGNDILMVGKSNSNGASTAPSKATYWLNGNGTDLTDGTSEAVANSIAINGNDIFISVIDGSAHKLFKNGSLQNLPSDVNFIYDICTSGSDVYVLADKTGAGPGVIKNGVWLYQLVFSSPFTYVNATSIFAKNNTVFVSATGITPAGEEAVIFRDGFFLYSIGSPGIVTSVEGIFYSGN